MVARVKVKYLGLMRVLANIGNEEIIAENLGELMDKVARRHEKIKPYLYERETTDPTLITAYNKLIVKNVRDYKMKLKDGDEIVLMSIIGGG